MKIGLWQLGLSDHEDKQMRISKVKMALEEVMKSKDLPDLLILPEIWGTGYQAFERYEEEAEEFMGVTASFLREYAIKLGIHIHTGSFVERREGELYNTSLLIGPGGETQAVYRKLHLFGYDSMETKLLSPGDGPCVCDSTLGRLMLATCYDLRFPEQFRFMKEVPEILLVCAAWPEKRLNHWRLFNQVRAVENQCFVISCNSCGSQEGVMLAGHSMVCDPYGEIVFEAEKEEGFFLVEIDKDLVMRARADFPALGDRVKIGEEE